MASTSVDSWPKRRRYLPLRWLHAPVRHVASVGREDDRFQAGCVCGWQGTAFDHPGDAFADAHLHTRHIDTKVDEPKHQEDDQ
jgi:hypothetical protein